MSFLKAQVTFPLNFASVFSAIRHNSPVLFLAQTCQRSQLQSIFFLDFRVLESKFVKFLMSVLKWQVNSSSNFALFFTAMAYNSSANLKVIPFLFWTKGFHQSPNFQVLWWKFAKFLSSFFQTTISFSSKFACLFSVVKNNFSVLL